MLGNQSYSVGIVWCVGLVWPVTLVRLDERIKLYIAATVSFSRISQSIWMIHSIFCQFVVVIFNVQPSIALPDTWYCNTHIKSMIEITQNMPLLYEHLSYQSVSQLAISKKGTKSTKNFVPKFLHSYSNRQRSNMPLPAINISI